MRWHGCKELDIAVNVLIDVSQELGEECVLLGERHVGGANEELKGLVRGAQWVAEAILLIILKNNPFLLI